MMYDISLFDILGFGGAALSLIAYYQVSTARWKPRSYRYQIANISAATFLGLYAIDKFAWASLMLNVIWGLVGVVVLFGIIKLGIHRHHRHRHRAKRYS